MRSFIVKLRELFLLDTGKTDMEQNFCEEKRVLRIPLYQREYKWEDEKIKALISDISKQHKFLGNVILDESTGWYEIADGQQRITTCYLMLVYLYNYYHGCPLEQQSILNILKPYNRFTLENDTIGTYLYKKDDSIELRISDGVDVYSQKAEFNRAYQRIRSELKFLVSPEQAREFKDKLLDSEVLVLINDEHPNTPIEQIFLDINEKAQLLDIEDIFKGHCFEIFTPEFHGRLRETWVELKKCSSGFKALGIKSLSDYIYLFLLEHDNADLPKKLNPKGRHYLEGKTMDATDALLMEMIAFGQSVLRFTGNLRNTQYRFIDICPDSQEHRNTDDHIALKAMCNAILIPSKALYQKLPFMYFIYRITQDTALHQEICHDSLRRIVTNLYIYATLFMLSPDKKSKEVIDHTVRAATSDTENRIAKIVSAAKALRMAAVEAYLPKQNSAFDELATIYSITDNYRANTNWISLVYSHEANYNLEHFIISDQRAAKILWCDGPRHFNITIDVEFAKANKKKTCNLLVLDQTLNEALNNYDIVTKIEVIQGWCASREISIPKHISVFISHIASLPEYQALQAHKNNGASNELIIADYQTFLDVYFAEQSENALMSLLRAQFEHAFEN